MAGGTNPTLLSVDDLWVELPTQQGLVHAVNGVSLSVASGEIVAVVGESGSGKSMTALSILGLVPRPGRIASGAITFQGGSLIGLAARDWLKVRGREIAMVFQDASASLNPVMTVGDQLREGLRIHLGLPRDQASRRAIELLQLVGIPSAAKRLDDYPHQFSGGMRQRVMIAIAVSCNPMLLICDEPTTSLDVTIQAQILDLLLRLRRDLATAILFITHDMGVVARIADRVVVMYAGEVMEQAAVGALFRTPTHPYTAALLDSVRRIDSEKKGLLPTIPGQPPDLLRAPTGCPFWQRCPVRLDPRCESERPELRPVAEDHLVASFYARSPE